MKKEKQHTDYQGTYQIVIKGILDQKWSEWFDGFTITYPDKSHTSLIGKVRDQSAVHGILANIRDLGLTLVSIIEMEEALEKYKPSDEDQSE